jgi:hypothetical protein
VRRDERFMKAVTMYSWVSDEIRWAPIDLLASAKRRQPCPASLPLFVPNPFPSRAREGKGAGKSESLGLDETRQ